MIIIPKRINIVGETYGDFTVVEMLYGYKKENNKTRTYCKCIGVDNMEYIIRMDALRNGSTTSIKNVGEKRVVKDLSGNKYGILTVLEDSGHRASNGNVIWKCKCDCGNICNVNSTNLTSGHTTSCGCRHQSKWELYIASYLTSINVEYEQQKRFDGCRNAQGSDMLPFDFYIPSHNTIIEYDGMHHFTPIDYWGGLDKYKITKENDLIKTKYCEQNNITLIRIPYTYTKTEIINTINDFISPVTITA